MRRHPEDTNQIPLAKITLSSCPKVPALEALLPAEVRSRLGVVPIARGDRCLMVGARQPLTSMETYELHVLTGLKIVTVQLVEEGGELLPIPDCAESLGARAPAPGAPRRLRPLPGPARGRVWLGHVS